MVTFLFILFALWYPVAAAAYATNLHGCLQFFDSLAVFFSFVVAYAALALSPTAIRTTVLLEHNVPSTCT